MTTASIDLQGTPHPVVDTDPHPAHAPLDHVRATFRYLRDAALYARDMADYIEARHMEAVNQRIDAIIGVNL